MTRAKRRLYLVLLGVAALGAATALVLTALKDQIVYFYSPSELQAKHVAADRHIRIGGLVDEGSVLKEGANVQFRVTDNVGGAQDFTIAFALSLKANPSTRVGEDTVNPSHLVGE